MGNMLYGSEIWGTSEDVKSLQSAHMDMARIVPELPRSVAHADPPRIELCLRNRILKQIMLSRLIDKMSRHYKESPYLTYSTLGLC